METLTTKQRAHLKSLAHALKPILHLGKDGVDDAVVATVASDFNTRELLKIKVLDTAPESAKETGAALAARVDGAHLVQVIGRTVVLYRPHPDKPAIRLPLAPSSRRR
jgi:RNA-binding protein